MLPLFRGWAGGLISTSELAEEEVEDSPFLLSHFKGLKEGLAICLDFLNGYSTRYWAVNARLAANLQEL